MWFNLEDALREAADAKIRNYERYCKRIHDENVRRTRRSSGTPPLLTARRPDMWDLEPALETFSRPQARRANRARHNAQYASRHVCAPASRRVQSR